MSYEVLTIRPFEKDLKRLAKKHASLSGEIAALGVELSQNPTLGVPLGSDCYKIRLAIRSKGSGKSGGGRVITAIYAAEKKVTFLALYDKSEQSTMTDEALKHLLALSFEAFKS